MRQDQPCIQFRRLKAVGLLSDTDANNPAIDPSFRAGQYALAATLGDDPSQWRLPYRNRNIHGVFLIAAWRRNPADGLIAATQMAKKFRTDLAEALHFVHEEPGKIRSGIGAGGIDQTGHEHFGFADGVSQPGVDGLTAPQNRNNPKRGFPGQDLVAPGEFVFGSNYAKEVPQNARSVNADPPLPWMENGSYLVFRRLNQNVEAFRHFVRNSVSHQPNLASGAAQFAARIVGRWPDGSPLVRNPNASNPNESEKVPALNNNFDFGPPCTTAYPPLVATDPAQQLCPFAAHVRRMYMRSDVDQGGADRRRILRAGIAFGDDDAQDKGLLFVCYQTSIVDKFEFIQKLASNPTPNGPGGDQLAFDPVMATPPIIVVDLVLASPRRATRVAHWATGDTPPAASFVVATGGGYFFTPSIAALTSIAT